MLTMISNPGDNRTALIAVLIAVPAAALISMAVHTFVPVQQDKPSVTVIAGAEAPREKFGKGPQGHRGHHAPGKEFQKGKFSKEDFKKRMMAVRTARMEALKQIVDLNKKRVALLEGQKNTGCPKKLILARRDYLLAESALFRQTARIRLEGVCVSDLAVKVVAAEKIAGLDPKKAPGIKDAEIAALDNQIDALQLKLELSRQRLGYNPQWKAAFEAFKKAQTVANLQAMLEAERGAMPPRRPR